MTSSLADLTAGDFEPLSGESFRLLAPAHELELKLAEIRRLGQARRREGGAFSLLFIAPPGQFLPQAISFNSWAAAGQAAKKNKAMTMPRNIIAPTRTFR